MCGIAGIANFDGKPVAREQISKMIARLEHRGPDGSGIWTRDNVGLGHRRLAIRDLSNAGLQPMIDHASGLAVTYNGEIYNDADLRRSIGENARFSTSCDTEVIAPSYRLWGQDAFLKFEGMYAMAIWDESSERITLARDPIGIKPLYFSWVGNSLRFASEIKALLALEDQPRQLSAEGLHRFFSQGYPGPERSLLTGIQPLPPGSTLVADRNGWRLQRFWTPQRQGRIASFEQALDEFENLWAHVVDDQLISDVPVGLLLSGGIDSSLIATALSHRKGLPAFTASFGNAAFDETELAAISARHAGLDHQVVEIDTEADIEARFSDVVAKVDGQLADASSLAFYSLCQKARAKVPVLLTGDGADEFFAGYETYRATRVAGIIGPFLPRFATNALATALFAASANSEGRAGTAEKLARFLAGLANGSGCPHPQWRRYLYPSDMDALYGTGMDDIDRTRDALDEYAAIFDSKGSLLDRALTADQRYYLPGDMLMKSDSMSMAHSIEVRVPFLDRRIMEFANSLDGSLLSPVRGPDKRLLRAALEAKGLPVTLTRASKRGFNVPIAGYMRKSLRSLGSRLLDKEADCLAPFLQPEAVRRLWRDHLDGDSSSSYTLWTFFTLALWRTNAGV